MLVVNESSKHETMMGKINSGAQLDSVEEITEDYKQNLLKLMIAQADSELAGAYGYVPWIEGAPTVAEKLAMANIVKDEVRHAKAIYDLVERLGVNVDQLIHEDKMKNRMQVFYEPIKTWADLVMFNFLMDRAAGHQLQDAAQCSWGPWAAAMVQIEKEELMHVRHGETWVRKLASDPLTAPDIQRALNFWFPKINKVFGKAGTQSNQTFRKYKLKSRDNDDVRNSWYKEITPLLESYGLTVPSIDVVG
ncbi:MAG: phenylacetate-CoA oxygenase subunit PaaI [Candidatus Melainabacteria bacterium]|nr:phenylacetate-CoA oxygenase subunit PaaI [Candidatus Melainabacteria bacterium]